MTKQIERKCQAILDALLGLDVVLKGRIWDRFPGKERIYVDLVKLDGNAGHNAGVGHTMFVDVHTGLVRLDKHRQWAGPKTQAFHERARTIQQVREVVAEFVRPNPRSVGEVTLKILRART